MLDSENTEELLTPGQHLKAEMKRLGYDQKSLAEVLGISRATINYIANDKQDITPHVANALAQLMELPAGYWLQDSFLPMPSYAQAKRTVGAEKSLDKNTGVVVDRGILEAVEQNEILIDPFHKEHLRQASLDLTIGDTVVLPDGESFPITTKKGWFLEPNETVLVNTTETIGLKNKMVGRVGPTTYFSSQGLLVLHGFQIDPGFKGQLQFSIHNLSRTAVEILSGERFISIELSRLTNEPELVFDQLGEDIRASQTRLRESLAGSEFFNFLEPMIDAGVQVTGAEDRWRAAVENLCDLPMSFKSRALAIRELKSEIRRSLSDLQEHAHLQSSVAFRKHLSTYLDLTEVLREDALKCCENVGFQCNGDGTHRTPDQEDTRLRLPQDDNGVMSLRDLATVLGIPIPANA